MVLIKAKRREESSSATNQPESEPQQIHQAQRGGHRSRHTTATPRTFTFRIQARTAVISPFLLHTPILQRIAARVSRIESTIRRARSIGSLTPAVHTRRTTRTDRILAIAHTVPRFTMLSRRTWRSARRIETLTTCRIATKGRFTGRPAALPTSIETSSAPAYLARRTAHAFT